MQLQLTPVGFDELSKGLLVARAKSLGQIGGHATVNSLMTFHDDDLSRFEASGPPALAATELQGYVEHDRARIWYATYGSGPPVILLHGGLGHSGNWGYQVPELVSSGYRVIVIDSRGHGRSTRDDRPYS